MTRFFAKTTLFLIAAAAVWLPPRVVAATSFTDIIVFGDSLSDTGNLDRGGLSGFLIDLFTEVGPTGSFTNGDVWHDYLADDLALPRAEPSLDGGTNYAIGGAETDRGGALEGFWADVLLGQQTGVEEQVEIFVNSYPLGVADPNALYVMWGGGNDMRNASSPSAAAPAVANLEQHVRSLAAVGAQHIMFPNLPNLGRTPESIQAGQAAVDLAQSISLAFNDELSLAADRLENDLPIDLYRLDVYSAMETLVLDGETFGFTNVTDPCPNPSGACSGYLFWDLIHPTTAAHEFLGDAALALLLGSPVGDLTGDGTVNLGDVPAMILALTDRASYAIQYPMVDAEIAGDIDASGLFDLGDLGPFAAMFASPPAATQAVPEPPALLLAILALLALQTRRSQISQKRPHAPT